MPLQTSSGFAINSIFWLRSLSEIDRGPTRRVLEDLQPYLQGIGVELHLQDVQSTSELYAALGMLARPGVRPIIQLDMHGAKEGLLLTPSGEMAPWDGVVPKLRTINITSGGNLCVVAGACYAYYAISKASILDASPVNILIGPDREVAAGKLEHGLGGFYVSLFSGGEIGSAVADNLGAPFQLFNAERFLVIALCKYIRDACKGRGAAARRERLLSEVLLSGRPRTPENMRVIRMQIKEKTKPNQDMLNKYADRFLLGRPCPFTIDQIIKLVEDAETK